MKKQMARTFLDLLVWQKAHALVLEVYQYSARFPNSEMYGLRSQIRRASVSVPANIAEGFKRRGKGDKSRFLNISQGSLEEVRYFLILSRDLGYGDPATPMRQVEEVSRLLGSYTGRVEEDSRRF
jgi:four helix bundle protein